MKKLKSVILTLAMSAFFSGAAVAQDRPLTVVELFTSQGCSSCPPADSLLGELAKREDVLALSIHVDYWDYIGWKDPFAAAAHGVRQKDYAAQFALRYVYTPQMVIHGAYQSVGSKRSEVFEHIEKAQRLPRVGISLNRTAKGVELVLPKAEIDEGVEVISVFYDRQHETKIRRGENSGQSLAYHNVVRDMGSMGRWRGEAARMIVPMAKTEADVCAVLLQSKKTGRIIGAARIDLTPS
jgi:hypothetical protein